MSFLEKSQNTIAAAGYLKEFGDEFIPTCVHCYYYSCLHLILFVLEDSFNIYKTDRDIEAKNMDKNSHEYLLVKIKECMKFCKVDSTTLKDFTKYFLEIKLARKKADYTHLTIENEEYEMIKTYSDKVLKTLYNTFNI